MWEISGEKELDFEGLPDRLELTEAQVEPDDEGDDDVVGLDVGAKLEDPSGVPLKVSDTELDDEGESAAVWELSGEEKLDREGLPEKLETIDADADNVA